MFSDLPFRKLNLATMWKIELILERLKTESSVKLGSESFVSLFRTNTLGGNMTSEDLHRL